MLSSLRAKGRARLAVVGAAVALTACASVDESALESLPGAGVEPDQPPLIVIPGVLASRLVDGSTGRRVWPPNIPMLLRGWRAPELAIPVPYRAEARAARLTPTDVVLSRPRRDYYSGLLAALAAVGYDCEARRDITADTNCVVFSWDWRRGFPAAAAELDRLVEELRARRGDPGLSVDLVGHSAGALVARYYARFGGANVLDAAGAADTARGRAGSAARRRVLVGPPGLGSVFAAQRLMRGYQLGVIRIEPEILATFESAYQLLPHPGRSWLIDVNGETVARDLYDPDTWREYELSIFDPDVRARITADARSADAAERRLRALEERFGAGLERARRFHAALSEDAAARERQDLLIVGSDCERTPRRMLVETAENRSRLRFEPAEIEQPVPGVDYAALMRGPGDGRVTRASMLALGAPRGATEEPTTTPKERHMIVCERHSEMTSNTHVQRAMLEFLLR